MFNLSHLFVLSQVVVFQTGTIYQQGRYNWKDLTEHLSTIVHWLPRNWDDSIYINGDLIYDI